MEALDIFWVVYNFMILKNWIEINKPQNHGVEGWTTDGKVCWLSGCGWAVLTWLFVGRPQHSCIIRWAK